MRQFRHLNVPEQWEHYWSKYPQGYTILEALVSWVSQVDTMVDNQNNLNNVVTNYGNRLDEFIIRFDPRLQEEVKKTLTDWQESGLLDEVIKAAISTDIDDLQMQLSSTRSLLSEKVSKGEQGIITWAMAAQDLRENISGGNTAVVGKNSIISDNIVNGAVTPDKTNFLTTKELNLFNKDHEENIDNSKLISGGIEALEGWFVSHYIPIKEGVTYERPTPDTSIVYNASKTQTRTLPYSAGNYFTALEGEAYIRIIGKMINKNTMMFGPFPLSTVYQPYGSLKVESKPFTELMRNHDAKNRLPNIDLNNFYESGNYWVTHDNVATNKPENLTEIFISIEPYNNSNIRFAIQTAYRFTGAVGKLERKFSRIIASNKTEQNSWLEESINTNGGTIQPLLNINSISIIGDSLSDPNNTESSVKWFDFVKEWGDVGVLSNYAMSGSCVGDGGAPVSNPMSNRYMSMTNDNDLNLIFGGVNDYGKNVPLGNMSDRTVDTFFGALHVLLSGFTDKFSTKKYGYIIFHKFGSGWSPISNSLGFTPQQYVNAIKEVCSYYSIPVLNLFENGGLYLTNAKQRGYYSTDGLHLNDLGQEYIANKIYKWINYSL